MLTKSKKLLKESKMKIITGAILLSTFLVACSSVRTKTVEMRGSDGTIYYIPENRVAEAERDGLVRTDTIAVLTSSPDWTLVVQLNKTGESSWIKKVPVSEIPDPFTGLSLGVFGKIKCELAMASYKSKSKIMIDCWEGWEFRISAQIDCRLHTSKSSELYLFISDYPSGEPGNFYLYCEDA